MPYKNRSAITLREITKAELDYYKEGDETWQEFMEKIVRWLRKSYGDSKE